MTLMILGSLQDTYLAAVRIETVAVHHTPAPDAGCNPAAAAAAARPIDAVAVAAGHTADLGRMSRPGCRSGSHRAVVDRSCSAPGIHSGCTEEPEVLRSQAAGLDGLRILAGRRSLAVLVAAGRSLGSLGCRIDRSLTL